MTILPERLTDENRVQFKSIFPVHHELDSKNANEILVKSSPKDTLLARAKEIQAKQLQEQKDDGRDAKQAKTNGQTAQLPVKVGSFTPMN